MAGIQDITHGGETIGGKVGLDKKSPKPQKHLSIKVNLWLGKPINEVRPKPVNSKFSVTSTVSTQKSVYQWNDDHTKASEELNKQIKNIIENNHFVIKKSSRLQTDASPTGLGATLEQWDGKTWLTKAFASRFLNIHDMKYSTNELKLLGVVWAPGHFKNYLYGAEFEIVTDNKALLWASNAILLTKLCTAD